MEAGHKGGRVREQGEGVRGKDGGVYSSAWMEEGAGQDDSFLLLFFAATQTPRE